MSRLRPIIGLAVSAMLLLSAAAHSLAGWPALSQELGKTNAPAGLVAGLQVGWHFGGIAMIVFELILTPVFGSRLAGRAVSAWPALVIGLGMSCSAPGHW